MLTLDHFDYQLPDDRIAQTPAEPRDSSKLLVVDRTAGALSDHIFRELPQLLQPTDVIVRNNTKVIPARIWATKPTGGQMELLLVKHLSHTKEATRWEVLTRPGIKLGQSLTLADSDITATCIEILEYSRVVEFQCDLVTLYAYLDRAGNIPIPPYIKWNDDDETHLREVYQTTFAKHQGSAAAPTAGLHFTPELDAQLREKGVEIVELTLHVGLGTFLPVKTNDIQQHHMHSETMVITPEIAAQLNTLKKAGRRIIAVGTTSTRALESATDERGMIHAFDGETDIYMYPPYRFRFVDALITNFHLPKSTLLMLISALVSAPNTDHVFTTFADTSVGVAYRHAIVSQYRFFSFGDAMLIE